MNKLNVYDNRYTSTVNDFKTVDEWFSLIKESEYSPIILQARSFGKGHKMYDSLKGTLPAITFNFTFKNTKANANIVSSTGYLYIDVDDGTFDIASLDVNKVFAYYKSFGGLGYSIIVKVEGLTLNNYNSTYSNILFDLGLSGCFDKGAKKATQYNILSFDPNIYINYNSLVFKAINESQNAVTPELIKTKKKEAYSTGVTAKKEKTQLRYDNLNEYQIEGTHIVDFESGFDYTKAFLPYYKKDRNRNSTLLSYSSNMVYLNPGLTPKGLTTILTGINQTIFTSPVDKANIKRVVDTVFKQKEAGTLAPIKFNKPRRIIFNPTAKLSYEDKMIIVSKELSNKYRELSQNKLYSIIEGWDFNERGTINYRSVVKYGKMGDKTLRKYWREFKVYIKELNDAFKSTKSKKSKVTSLKPEGVKQEYSSLIQINAYDELFTEIIYKEQKVFFYEFDSIRPGVNKLTTNEALDFFKTLFCANINSVTATTINDRIHQIEKMKYEDDVILVCI